MFLLWLLIVPLVASPLAFVLRKRHFMEAINLVAFAVLLCLAAALGVRVLRSGPVSVWDGFFYADALSALVVLLSAFFVTTRVTEFSRRAKNLAADAPLINYENTTRLLLSLFFP